MSTKGGWSKTDKQHRRDHNIEKNQHIKLSSLTAKGVKRNADPSSSIQAYKLFLASLDTESSEATLKYASYDVPLVTKRRISQTPSQYFFPLWYESST